MVKHERVFAALGDPTRAAIVSRLARGEATLSELAHPFELSLPGVLKHVRVLEEANVIRCEKVGRARVCRLDGRQLERSARWLQERAAAWEHRLDRLGEVLDKGKKR